MARPLSCSLSRTSDAARRPRFNQTTEPHRDGRRISGQSLSRLLSTRGATLPAMVGRAVRRPRPRAGRFLHRCATLARRSKVRDSAHEVRTVSILVSQPLQDRNFLQ